MYMSKMHTSVCVYRCFKRACESEREFLSVSSVCVGVYLSRALSFIPFDVLLSVNYGRTDALPLLFLVVPLTLN